MEGRPLMKAVEERSLGFQLGYRWWLVRHYFPAGFRYHLKETLPWKIALWLPRKVALLAFIRVYGVMGSCGPEFDYICKEWERRGKKGA